MNTIKDQKKDLSSVPKEHETKPEKLGNVNKKPLDDTKLPNLHSKQDQGRKSK